MMEIFLIQLLAAGLGALSTASADWCYNRARIGARLVGLGLDRRHLSPGAGVDLNHIPRPGAARAIAGRDPCRRDVSLGLP